MTTQTEALKLADALNELLESFEKDGRFCKSSSIRNELYDRLKQTLEESREALAQPEQERCVGCEACIDTACGRDECPKGWPKAAQPEQEPVAFVKGCNRGQWEIFPAKAYQIFGIEQPLYTTPPQRKPLTDEQRKSITAMWSRGHRNYTVGDIIDAVEEAHGINKE